ncbi:LacI family DNA-binding transcriptional regulator [Kineococcus sp. TBRC 1896]|uniref:LacI family DNA-binding transcriptional regulator n=1 Tax=Kineococcus mangrovi TaxID=1660183 RepID=A0ABV4I5S0_9ACTN
MTRPTIRSVAARAGVSKSLVSLVLQDSPKVSPERRAAVLAAVAELGYRPDPTARSLAQGRTRAIGLVLDDLRNPWFVDVLEGLRPVLHAAGLRPVLAEARSEPDAPRTFADLRVDGLVVIGTLPDLALVEEVAAEVPTVLAGTRLAADDPFGVDVVAGDDAAGVRLAVEHLVGLGHRRLAHVAGTGPVGDLRRSAFEGAARTGGAEVLVETGPLTEDGGHRAGRALLTRTDPPTAVLAANDASAVGVLAAAADLGVEVPGALSVAGYDDTSLARLRAVSLTSVDNAASEVGRLAARRLLDRLVDPDAPADLQLVAPRLVVRATTAPPAGGGPSTDAGPPDLRR